MLSANDENDANQAYIHAIGLDGPIDGQLPHTSGEARITGSITRQVSPKNTFSIRPNYQYESDENRDAGGTTLASAATTFKHHEQQVTYTQQTIFRPTLVNQFNCCSATSGPTTQPHARSRHRRRRGVHRRRRAGRSRSDGDAHHLNESLVDSRQAFRAGGIPTARLEQARLLRPYQLRGLFYLPTSSPTRRASRTRLPSSRATATWHCSKAGGRVRQRRLAVLSGPLDRLRRALRLAELFRRHQ